MTFVVWVDKVLNFSHLELPDSQKSISWSDLVPKTKTDLSCCKWKSSAIVVNEFVKVNKHSLSSLRPQITNQIGGWTNLCLKHQIKGHGF